MSIGYVREKLMQAVNELATGTGRIQDRLYAASAYLARVEINEVPIEMRSEFERVLNALQKPTRELSGLEKIRASNWGPRRVACDQLSDAETTKLAETILVMYDDAK